MENRSDEYRTKLVRGTKNYAARRAFTIECAACGGLWGVGKKKQKLQACRALLMVEAGLSAVANLLAGVFAFAVQRAYLLGVLRAEEEVLDWFCVAKSPIDAWIFSAARHYSIPTPGRARH